MSGENPYAPPETTSTGVPDAPESFGWEMVGKRVWVEKFAQFPMVDPYSGKTDDVMTMNRITLRYWPAWMTVLRWISLGIILLPLSGAIEPDLKMAIALAGVLALIVTMIASTFFPITGLKVFFTTKTLRWRVIQHWLVSACFVVGILSGMRVERTGLPSGDGQVNVVSSAGFCLWILGLIWIYVLRRRLKCRRHKDGRFEIRGIHPKALALLAREKGSPPVSPEMDSLSSSR